MAISLFSYLTDFYGKFGEALISRGALTQLANFTVGSRNSIVALPGGAQAGSPVLSIGSNELNTVATTNDSVQLPPAIPGATVVVNNNGASTAKIYANIAPNLNNANALNQIVANATVALTANATAITLASGYTLGFVCTTIGRWKQQYVAS